jgi:predicted RNA binding protein YcfA (HicA-like mRNA interferase family)
MKPTRLLKRIARTQANVRFSDLLALAQALGFRLARIEGSHHILIHPAVREPLNVQDVQGQAKPYQVRQLVQIIERYNLHLEQEE